MRRSALFALCVSLVATPAFAQSGIDAQENVFGAANVNATVGHGRLTIGVSEEGDWSVVSWPSPSYNDQLAYRTSNAFDAREQPHFGALDGAGVVLGLVVDTGAGGEVTWLREAPWSRSQSYGQDDGPHPHTVYVDEARGLTVTVVDAIDPDVDVAVRRITVERAASSPVVGASLLTYANLSPLPPDSRVPQLPIVDWVKDGENDFAAVWDEAATAVVHFHPQGQRVYDELLGLVGTPAVEWGPFGVALQSPSLDAVQVADLVAAAGSYDPGAYALVGTVPAPDAHQVGFDRGAWCSQLEALLDNMTSLSDTFEDFELFIDEETARGLLCKQSAEALIAAQGWQYVAEDPWLDAADGTLSMADAAAGEVAEAFTTPLTFSDGRAEASVVVGFGATLDEARAAFAVGQAPAALIARSEAATEAWEAGLTIPGEVGTRVHDVARRTLFNLRVGTDAQTGAVVASISRQPPYQLDWPRDGAFFNVVFDASGQTELVEQRIDLYASWQRTTEIAPTLLIDPPPPEDPRTGAADRYPADAWEMNYFADGMVGGLFRFEIDTTAFAVWTAVAHAGWAEDPAEALRSRWDSIRRGADLIAAWRDPLTGLQAPAQEDDAARHTQTLHGAITVFGALDIAARGARLLGEDADAERWEQRAIELRGAMRAFYDDEEGVYVMSESDRLPILASGLVPTGPTAWLVWPMTLHPFEQDVMQRQLERDLSVIEAPLQLTNAGGLYYMKNTISLVVGARRPELVERAQQLPAVLADQATKDTDQFGEVMVVVERDGEPVPEQRVATPHLWEASLFYLTALGAENPQTLLAYDDVLPRSRVLYPSLEPEDEGCGCQLPGRPAPPRSGWWLPFALLPWLRRRRGGACISAEGGHGEGAGKEGVGDRRERQPHQLAPEPGAPRAAADPAE